MCVQHHALKSAQDYQRFFGVDQPASPGKHRHSRRQPCLASQPLSAAQYQGVQCTIA